MNNECTIHELVLQIVEALKKLGLKPHTVWNYYSYAYLPIVKFHNQHNTDFFNRAIVDEYEQIIDQRHKVAVIIWILNCIFKLEKGSRAACRISRYRKTDMDLP